MAITEKNITCLNKALEFAGNISALAGHFSHLHTKYDSAIDAALIGDLAADQYRQCVLSRSTHDRKNKHRSHKF